MAEDVKKAIKEMVEASENNPVAQAFLAGMAQGMKCGRASEPSAPEAEEEERV